MVLTASFDVEQLHGKELLPIFELINAAITPVESHLGRNNRIQKRKIRIRMSELNSCFIHFFSQLIVQII